MLSLNLIPGAIAEILVAATNTQALSLADRYGLLAAILEETLTEEERTAIDRLLRSVRRGKIQLINELSTVL